MDNRKRYEIVVGDTTYALGTMGADSANTVLFTIGEAIGVPLEHFLRAAGPQAGLASVFQDQLTMAVGVQLLTLLVRNLGSKGFLDVRDQLLAGVSVNNKVVDDLDLLFAGRLMDMYQVMWEAIKENYEDFLGALRLMFGQSNTETLPASDSPE